MQSLLLEWWERRERGRLNYLLWRCCYCWSFHETPGPIINMRWHMHTSKMIPDASVMDHKTPQGAFRSTTLLRATAASRMNHRVAARMCGKREAARGWKWRWWGAPTTCVFYAINREGVWRCVVMPSWGQQSFFSLLLFFPWGQKKVFTSKGVVFLGPFDL